MRKLNIPPNLDHQFLSQQEREGSFLKEHKKQKIGKREYVEVADT